jgi:energy-coupling factor transporter ATP-binding protein EcfA2
MQKGTKTDIFCLSLTSFPHTFPSLPHTKVKLLPSRTLIPPKMDILRETYRHLASAHKLRTFILMVLAEFIIGTITTWLSIKATTGEIKIAYYFAATLAISLFKIYANKIYTGLVATLTNRGQNETDDHFTSATLFDQQNHLLDKLLDKSTGLQGYYDMILGDFIPTISTILQNIAIMTATYYNNGMTWCIFMIFLFTTAAYKLLVSKWIDEVDKVVSDECDKIDEIDCNKTFHCSLVQNGQTTADALKNDCHEISQHGMHIDIFWITALQKTIALAYLCSLAPLMILQFTDRPIPDLAGIMIPTIEMTYSFSKVTSYFIKLKQGASKLNRLRKELAKMPEREEVTALPPPRYIGITNVDIWITPEIGLQMDPSIKTIWIARERATLFLGPSGCGKTLLLNALAGAFNHSPPAKIPDSTIIDLSDAPKGSGLTLRGGADIRCYRDNLFAVVQGGGEIYKVPTLTFATIFPGASETEIRFWLQLVELNDRFPSLGAIGGGLSGGQRQRLHVAAQLRLFASQGPTGPQILALDEPTNALDFDLGYRILNKLLYMRYDTEARARIRRDFALILICHIERPDLLRGVTQTVLFSKGLIEEVIPGTPMPATQ